MTTVQKLDARSAGDIVEVVEQRFPAYVPGWRPAARGPGAAVVQVFARYLKALADCINQAPTKNELAFFDLLGIELLPPQAARAPLVFVPLTGVPDSRVPQGSRVGAKIAGQADPLVFETERAIALATAHLVEVRTLWPGRDAVADHSAALAAGQPFTLFQPLVPTEHSLYLANDGCFAVTGKSTVEVQFQLAAPGNAALTTIWEYWDGEVWRTFKDFLPSSSATISDSLDGTAGFTRSGTIRIVSDCASSALTSVEGIPGMWIRARVANALTSATMTELPMIDRITVRTVIDKTLPAGACAALGDDAGMLPDAGYADAMKLDLTKSIQPLGARPQYGSAFYLRSEEIFAKAGAEVTLCFAKPQTPEEKADAEGAAYGSNVNSAQGLVVQAAIDEANALLAVSTSIRNLANDITDPTVLTPKENAVIAARNALAAQGIAGIAALASAAADLWATMWAVDTGLTFSIAGLVWDLLAAPLAAILPGVIWDSFKSFRDTNEIRIDNAAIWVRSSAFDTELALKQLAQLTPSSAAMAAGATPPFMDAPVLTWEYWNGAGWRALSVNGTTAARTFTGDGPVTFTVPNDLDATTVNTVNGRWIRARLVSGGYGVVRTVNWTDQTTGKIQYMPIVEYRPPTLEHVKLGYLWRSAPADLEHCLAYNDFMFVDATENAVEIGESFAPFAPLSDATPTLYLGFDAPLPADLVSVFLDIDEVIGDTLGPKVDWECWSGAAWESLRVEDETVGFALPGIASMLYPGVPPAAPMLARFGTPRTWIRARLHFDETPRASVVNSIALNAVWAAQHQTAQSESIGSSTGEPDQVFFARNVPVLEGETLEVRELDGPRAFVEEPGLREELAAAGVPWSYIRTVADARTGRTSEIWVRWTARANLLFSPPGAREYAIERTRGRILFGGGAHGMIPPAGKDNLRLRLYQWGGGTTGNASANGITQLLAGVLAKSVANPIPAEGGSNGESLDRLLVRAPTTIRDRMQPISAEDYESLAMEASPAVAIARALPTTHPSGRFAPGWVTVQVVPQSIDARPYPSFTLRQEVQRYLATRAPAAVAGHVAVIPPTYLPVGVQAVLSPIDASAAGDVIDRATVALEAFLHPLTGGPNGTGWPFGRDVFISDIAALLEDLDGVDYADTLMLLVNGTPVDERATVPMDRIVVAGPLLLSLSGGAG